MPIRETVSHVAGGRFEIHYQGTERVIQRCGVCGVKLADSMESDVPPSLLRIFPPGSVVQMRYEDDAVLDVCQPMLYPEDGCIDSVEATPCSPSSGGK